MNKRYFILPVLLILIFSLYSSTTVAKDPVYNARMNLEITWKDTQVEKPVIPRYEVKKVELNVVVNIETGPSFGEGVFEGYNYPDSFNVIHLKIVETPSWCSAVLGKILVVTQMNRTANTTVDLYIVVNEDAPAYGGEGIIKIQAESEDSGLIKGTNETFELPFIPDYIPIIKVNLPEFNSKRVTPSETAVFPIEVENIGNARTKVDFEIENLPKGWTATVTDALILGEEKGSKATAYLSVIPSNQFGYHDDDANIKVKITPAMAENISKVGAPLYANFVIQNRGFSNAKTGIMLPVVLIAIIIIIFLAILFRKRFF